MMEKIKKNRFSLMDLDQNVMIPYQGYEKVEDYY